MLKILFFLCVFVSSVFASENFDSVVESSPDYIRGTFQRAVNAGIKDADFFEKIINADMENQEKIELIEKVIMSKQKGYSEDLFISKILEGMAKNVPAKNIRYAVDKLGERFEYATKVTNSLNISTSNRDLAIKNIVDGLSSGMDQGHYNKLSESFKKNEDEQFYVEVTGFAKDLSRVKLDSDEIVGVLLKMYEKGYSQSEISLARKSFRNSLKAKSPGAVLSGLKNAVNKGARGSELGKGMEGLSGSGKGGYGGSGSGSGGGSNGGKGGKGGKGGGKGK